MRPALLAILLGLGACAQASQPVPSVVPGSTQDAMGPEARAYLEAHPWPAHRVETGWNAPGYAPDGSYTPPDVPTTRTVYVPTTRYVYLPTYAYPGPRPVAGLPRSYYARQARIQGGRR